MKTLFGENFRENRSRVTYPFVVDAIFEIIIISHFSARGWGGFRMELIKHTELAERESADINVQQMHEIQRFSRSNWLPLS